MNDVKEEASHKACCRALKNVRDQNQLLETSSRNRVTSKTFWFGSDTSKQPTLQAKHIFEECSRSFSVKNLFANQERNNMYKRISVGQTIPDVSEYRPTQNSREMQLAYSVIIKRQFCIGSQCHTWTVPFNGIQNYPKIKSYQISG